MEPAPHTSFLLDDLFDVDEWVWDAIASFFGLLVVIIK